MSTATTTDAPETTPTTPSKGLHYGLWAVQLLLAFAFAGAGMMKLTTPLEALAEKMTWIAQGPSFLPRFIGASELAGALGLVLPAATRIAPALTPLAAAGLTVVMGLAALTHVALGEFGGLVAPFVLGGLAAFVAYGRHKLAPIAPRS